MLHIRAQHRVQYLEHAVVHEHRRAMEPRVVVT